MKSKNTKREGSSHSVRQQEGRRRQVFIFKLLFFVVIILIQLRYPELTTDYGVSSHIIEAVLFYVTAHMIISFTRLFLVYLYIKRSGHNNEFKDNFVLGISQIANILSFVAVVFAIFLLFNINARDFFTSISIVAAAIAIISKDYISNMINGMIIMFSDQLSLEDYVKVGTHKGKIVNITLLNTHILNDDDDLIYIPNNTVLSSDIINYTKRNIKKITLEFELNERSFKHYETLGKEFEQILSSYKDIIKEGSPVLKVMNIHKDALNIKFQFLMTKRNREIEREIKRKLNQAIIHMLSTVEEERIA
jgi:small-conductance mechanosensitive channel